MMIPVKDGKQVETLNNFFRSILERGIVDALLLPQGLFENGTYAHTLVKDPQKITHAQPFLPVLMNNGGTILSELTSGVNSTRIGAVLRACEIRALYELSKFNQVDLNNLFIIGVDCLGTMEPSDFAGLVGQKNFTAEQYISALIEGKQDHIRTACRVCPYPRPEDADMNLGFIGTDPAKELFVDCSEEIADRLDLKKEAPPGEMVKKVDVIRKEKTELLDKLLSDMKGRFGSVTSLLNQFARCKRCYNCRAECPICFCNECIFLTNIFHHEPNDYIRWAERKGVLRMPYDTLLFHLTRLNHMAFSCVGCGQCSSACPNNLPVFELFQYAGKEVQNIFNYAPGQKTEDEPPILTFREKELEPL